MLSTLSINFFFREPPFQFQLGVQDIPHTVAFLSTALLISSWSSARKRAENRLRQSEQELREARDQLESKVKKRTADLSRSNEALRKSEEQWRDVFENNPTMYFMVDPTGTVLSVNPFGAEQLGYTVEELVGESVLKVFPESDRDSVKRNVVICLEQLGRSMGWEVRQVRKDGTILWVRETAKAVPREDQPIVLIAGEDISERKRAEALLAGEKRLL